MARLRGELEPVGEITIADAVNPDQIASQEIGNLGSLVRLDPGKPVVWCCCGLVQNQDLGPNRDDRADRTLLTRRRREEGN